VSPSLSSIGLAPSPRGTTKTAAKKALAAQQAAARKANGGGRGRGRGKAAQAAAAAAAAAAALAAASSPVVVGLGIRTSSGDTVISSNISSPVSDAARWEDAPEQPPQQQQQGGDVFIGCSPSGALIYRPRFVDTIKNGQVINICVFSL